MSNVASIRIYLRHADKLYSNGHSETYKHDPGIVDTEEKRIVAMANYLISQYGIPTAVICSPYLRTRQTAGHIVTALKQRGHDVPLYVDVRISEYLGNRAQDILDVTPDTAQYHPPHPERFHQLDRRVEEHNAYAPENAWYITHGLVIDRLIRHITGNGTKIKGIDPLTAVVITRTGSDYKVEKISPPP